jgi:hypothetical protein
MLNTKQTIPPFSFFDKKQELKKLEELNVELPNEETNSSKAEIQAPRSDPMVSHTKKPRALIIKATNQDFAELKELVKSKFPDVQILYMTTGPAASILRVTRVAPVELEKPSEQSLYSIE